MHAEIESNYLWLSSIIAATPTATTTTNAQQNEQIIAAIHQSAANTVEGIKFSTYSAINLLELTIHKNGCAWRVQIANCSSSLALTGNISMDWE